MPDPSEVPVLEPGMKVKWNGGGGVFTVILGPSPLGGAYLIEGEAGLWRVARGIDLTPVPQMATFSLDLGDGRCGSVEVPVEKVDAVAEGGHFRVDLTHRGLFAAVIDLVRDVVQGKGED